MKRNGSRPWQGALALAVAMGVLSAPAGAGSYLAASDVVAAGSTAIVGGGGDPRYAATEPFFGGVAAVVMQYDDGSSFVCTGALISRRAMLTAAHCLSADGGKAPDRIRAYFTDSSDPDLVRYDPMHGFDPVAGAVAVDVGRTAVNPGYRGEVIDENDLAVLYLSADAPAFADPYPIYWGDDLAGRSFVFAGVGERSLAGGDTGADLGLGRLRQGMNRYDFSWGDARFGGFFTDGSDNYFGTAAIADGLVSDFDDGTGAHDASCILGLGIAGTDAFCDPGLGWMEAALAAGDSGGPGFVDGRLASIASYGLSFGSDWGDIDDQLNSSFGELTGHVPLFVHRSWLQSVVPEPEEWLLMLAGFAVVGIGLRRRRDAGVAASR